MVRCFALQIIYIKHNFKSNLFVAESTENEPSCLSQPEMIFRKTEQSVVLTCNVLNCSSESLHYQWFVFRDKHHFRLTLTSRHSLDGASLQINSLNTSDSGIYHCAINSTSKTECCRHHVGLGTTLVVKGKEVLKGWLQGRKVSFNLVSYIKSSFFFFLEHLKPKLRRTLLWLAFILLSLYSLALVAFIILKKVNSVYPKWNVFVEHQSLNAKKNLNLCWPDMSGLLSVVAWLQNLHLQEAAQEG